MFEKVLVCLDGSKASGQILEYITGDVCRSASKVVLLRVISLPEVTVPLSVPGVPGLPISTEGVRKQAQQREDEANEYLKRIAAQLEDQGVDVECVVVPGMSGETIVEYAAENGCTLIALGTHGHSFARRFFLGSTADYVLRHTNVPVLAIGPKEEK